MRNSSPIGGLSPTATKFNGSGANPTDNLPAGLLRKRGNELKNEDSFLIFSRIPSPKLWLRSGLVERQTSATDFVWQPRMMILTDESIIFAKPETDAVVDRLPLRNVTFVGKVDRRQDAPLEQDKWGSFSKKKKRRKNSTTALFSPAARPTLAAEGNGDTSMRGGGFALEIRTAAEDRERSYFFRTDTMEAREAWLTHILDAVRAAAAAKSEDNSPVARIQVVLRSKNACIPCSRDGVARADSPGVAVRQLAGQVRRHFRHPHRLPRGGNPPPPPCSRASAQASPPCSRCCWAR